MVFFAGPVAFAIINVIIVVTMGFCLPTHMPTHPPAICPPAHLPTRLPTYLPTCPFLIYATNKGLGWLEGLYVRCLVIYEKTLVASLKSNLLLNIQMYNMSSLHKFD